MSSRKRKKYINNIETKNSILQHQGVPQGSVLRRLIINLFTNSLNQNFVRMQCV